MSFSFMVFRSSEYRKVKPDHLSEEDLKLKSLYQATYTQTSTIVIEIANQPTIRLIRNIKFTRLDFIVIGSIIGLFFGASILSFAEIIYIWMIRKF